MKGMNGTLSSETLASRYIVGRVARGQSLQNAFRGLAEEHALRAAWVSAIGAFEWLELTEYDQTARRYEQAHRFERCELLSMQGNLSLRDGEPFWHLHATVSLRQDGNDVTYGGHVEDGVVFALEFRIECFDDLELARVQDDATGLHLWDDPRSASSEQRKAAPANAAAGEVSWAMAAAASTASEPAPAPREPTRGDWIEHVKFGLCKVEGVSGDGVCIIKLPDATRKKIKLDAMRVLPPRNDGNRTVFPIRPKRRS